MADSVKYLAKADCLVFGKYRSAGQEFSAPEWKMAYSWPMPDFIEVIGAQGEAQAAPKAPAAPEEPKAPKPTAARALKPTVGKEPKVAPGEQKAPVGAADLG